MLLRHIKYDVRRGILSRWYYFVPLVLLTVFVMFEFYDTVDFYAKVNKLDILPTFTDAVINLFKGMKIFDPKSQEDFKIPAFWLVNNIYILFIAADYPLRDITGFGKQTLIKSHQRKYTWFSKCICIVLTIALAYLLEYLTVLAMSLLNSGSLNIFCPTAELHRAVSGFGADVWANGDWAMYVFVLPFLTSVALAILQLLLSLVFNTVTGFLTNIIIVVASAYYFSPFLIGNYAMLYRSPLVLKNGVNFKTALIVESVIIVLTIFFGRLYFERYDILERRKG